MSGSILNNKTRKRFFRYEMSGFFFTSAAAAILHFLYEWSGKELLTALFSAVNESVWEHLKIFSLPYVVWGFVEIFCAGVPFKRLAASKVIGLYFMIITIPVFFYTYTGIFGKNVAAVDIISGFAITALSFVVSYRLTTAAPYIERYFTKAMLLFALYCTMTAFFTFAPPRIDLFKDPQTGGYGLDQS